MARLRFEEERDEEGSEPFFNEPTIITDVTLNPNVCYYVRSVTYLSYNGWFNEESTLASIIS